MHVGSMQYHGSQPAVIFSP